MAVLSTVTAGMFPVPAPVRVSYSPPQFTALSFGQILT